MSPIFKRMFSFLKPSDAPKTPEPTAPLSWEETRAKAIELVRKDVFPECESLIREKRAEHGEDWIGYMSVLELPNGSSIPRGHFEFGMNIRNHFRKNGLLDESTPTGNWDDHYISVIEAALDEK